MANKEQLEIINQGVEIWNRWRADNPQTYPDLTVANLAGANLCRARLDGANLTGARLPIARLDGARLTWANLTGANLAGADLREADFGRATLVATDLKGANLSEANLTGAFLMGAFLGGADLSRATIGSTVFAGIDLSTVKGLKNVRHSGPSMIGVDTIYHSNGHIPESFLQGVGLPDNFIIYVRALTARPIEFYSCFISYSSKDQDFADRLYTDLQSRGVRCWFAPEDLKIGAETRNTIDESIRLHDKLLLILTEHSVSSQWVEHEVEAALEREEERTGWCYSRCAWTTR